MFKKSFAFNLGLKKNKFEGQTNPLNANHCIWNTYWLNRAKPILGVVVKVL